MNESKVFVNEVPGDEQTRADIEDRIKLGQGEKLGSFTATVYKMKGDGNLVVLAKSEGLDHNLDNAYRLFQKLIEQRQFRAHFMPALIIYLAKNTQEYINFQANLHDAIKRLDAAGLGPALGQNSPQS